MTEAFTDPAVPGVVHREARASAAEGRVSARGSGEHASDASGMTDAEVTRAFSTSVMISGIRCIIGYIVFPWLLPLLGVARGVGPVVGLVIGIVAIGFNVASIRRFQMSRHRWRWAITVLNLSVIGLLSVLVAQDLAAIARG